MNTTRWSVRDVDGLAADAPTRQLVPKPPIRFNPLVRLPAAATLLFGCLFVHWLAMWFTPIGWASGVWESIRFEALYLILPAPVAYLLLVLVVERRRPPVELAPRRVGGLVLGVTGGVAMIGAGYGLIMLLGGYRLTAAGAPDLRSWWATVFLGLGVAISQEVVFRGLLFRFAEEGVGTWGAAALTGVAFGLVHLLRHDTTWWHAIALALGIGPALGVLYALTRSLWWTIGFHAAWNVMQGPVLGIVVSGTGTPNGRFVTDVARQTMWQGRYVGPEGESEHG